MENQNDRFALEQRLMECWNIVDDLDVLFEYVCETDRDKLDQDKIANVILGLKTLYQMKHERAFDMFENLIANGSIK